MNFFVPSEQGLCFGALHSRVLDLSPPPHDLEHRDHVPHALNGLFRFSSSITGQNSSHSARRQRLGQASRNCSESLQFNSQLLLYLESSFNELYRKETGSRKSALPITNGIVHAIEWLINFRCGCCRCGCCRFFCWCNSCRDTCTTSQRTFFTNQILAKLKILLFLYHFNGKYYYN